MNDKQPSPSQQATYCPLGHTSLTAITMLHCSRTHSSVPGAPRTRGLHPGADRGSLLAQLLLALAVSWSVVGTGSDGAVALTCCISWSAGDGCGGVGNGEAGCGESGAAVSGGVGMDEAGGEAGGSDGGGGGSDGGSGGSAGGCSGSGGVLDAPALSARMYTV